GRSPPHSGPAVSTVSRDPDVRRPDSAAPAIASWIQADAGVSAETFGKCLTQLHWTSPRERLASDVPFLCPFPNGKFKGVIRPNGPWCVPHPRPGRLAPRLNPQPRQHHTLVSLADLPPRHCRGCGSLHILLRRMKHPPRLWLPAAACRPAARR